MSRPYATDEQYERWFTAECCRCGRRMHKAGHWPDGFVCRTCADRAVKLRGRCPGCGTDRALPGLRPGDGAAICARCAGFSQTFDCSRCGYEGKLHAGKLCTRCTLADRLAELLDDGTGRIRPELVALAEALTAMPNPLSGLTWLTPRSGVSEAADLLRGLGRGEIELTHQAFHGLQHRLAAEHLRDLLVSCGLLPYVDRQICSFERFLISHLDSIADPHHRRLIQRFATWDVLPGLRRAGEVRPLTSSSRKYAFNRVSHATAFLAWLDERGQTLRSVGQGGIDVWFAEHGEHDRTCLRPFLAWAAANRETAAHKLPKIQTRASAPLSQTQRLELLRKVLTDETAALRSRVAAAIVLLYAQPLTRIARITLDDVIHDGGQLLLRLGDPPSPVPAPVADLIERHIAERTNMRTANPASPWLFPGRSAGQPLRSEYLSDLLHAIGVPTNAARGAALRQHLLEMPAPVVADALNYHYNTAARLAAETGTDWSRYAAGNHDRLRTPTGWQPRRDHDT